MKAMIPKSKSENRAFGLIAVAAVLLVMLFTTVARGDAIDDGLSASTPAAVKASTRQAVQSGLELQSVIKLTRAMQQNKFNEQQIQLAHALVIEAKNSSMPVQPLSSQGMRLPSSVLRNSPMTNRARKTWVVRWRPDWPPGYPKRMATRSRKWHSSEPAR